MVDLERLGRGNALYLSIKVPRVPQEQPIAEMAANATAEKRVLSISWRPKGNRPLSLARGSRRRGRLCKLVDCASQSASSQLSAVQTKAYQTLGAALDRLMH